jgi:hypothetical protein
LDDIFNLPVKLQVPLKVMFQRYSAAVVGSLLAVKEINIVKSSEKLQGVKHVKQQQVGVPPKKSRTQFSVIMLVCPHPRWLLFLISMAD